MKYPCCRTLALASLGALVALGLVGCASTSSSSSGCATTRSADATVPDSIPVAHLAPVELVPPPAPVPDRLLGGDPAALEPAASTASTPTRPPITSPAVTAPRAPGEGVTAAVPREPKERTMDPVWRNFLDNVHLEASAGAGYLWR